MLNFHQLFEKRMYMTDRFNYKDFGTRYHQTWENEVKNKETLKYPYDIFYSHIVRSDVMIIGHNPGGDPLGLEKDDNKSEPEPKAIFPPSLDVKDGFHEYTEVDGYESDGRQKYLHTGSIYSPMRKYLSELFEIEVSAITAWPKINTVFHRSQSENDFAKPHGYNIWDAGKIDKPFVNEIIKYVRPKCIIVEGMTAWDKLKYFHGANESKPVEHDGKAFCAIGGRNVRLARLFDTPLNGVDREVRALVLAHPSRYGNWQALRDHDATIRTLFNNGLKK